MRGVTSLEGTNNVLFVLEVVLLVVETDRSASSGCFENFSSYYISLWSFPSSC